MRYRSYGRTDVAVSALTLDLVDTPGKARAADWRGIVFAGLENGVNAFDVHAGASPGLLAGAGEAFAAIERRLSFITLRCRIEAGDLESGAVLRTAVEAAEKLGLQAFNCLMLEGEHLQALSEAEIRRLADLREVTRQIGMAGADRIDEFARRQVIDAVAADYSLASAVRERTRIRTLADTGVAVVVDHAFPEIVFEKPGDSPKRGLFSKPAYKAPGGYEFLRDTWGWTPEQICIAYVLTEPGVTSVRVTTTDARWLASLAEAVDRDVPGGLGAQVEMARFTSGPEPEDKRRRA